MKREEIIEALEHVTEKLKEKELLTLEFTPSSSNKSEKIGVCCPVCELSTPLIIYGRRVKYCFNCGQRIGVNND